MTLEDLKTRCINTGLKYAYGRFEESVTPPHVIVTNPESENFVADNVVYLKVNSIILELTTTKKDLDSQLELCLKEIINYLNKIDKSL